MEKVHGCDIKALNANDGESAQPFMARLYYMSNNS